MGAGRPPEVDKEAQKQAADLERERLDLERQASESQTKQLELLQQQLAKQNQINQQQVSFLTQLDNEATQTQTLLSTLLEQQTGEAVRQAGQLASEAQRAQLVRGEEQQNVASLLVDRSRNQFRNPNQQSRTAGSSVRKSNMPSVQLGTTALANFKSNPNSFFLLGNR